MSAYVPGLPYSGSPVPRLPIRPATTVITGFQAGHGFTTNGAGVGSSNLNDTSDFVKGTQAVSVTTLGTGAAAQCNVQKNSVATDTTGKQLVVYVKIDDVTHLNKLNVFLSVESAFTNFYRWTIQNTPTATDFIKSGEWVRLTLSFADAAVTGAPTRNMPTGTVRFQCMDNGTGTVTVRWGGLEMQPEPASFSSGVVSITADDCWDSIYTLGKPRMDLYGFPMTNYVIAEEIGTAENLTIAHLRKLQDIDGWEIAGHAYSSVNHNLANGFADLSLNDADEEMRRLRTWMTDNGFRGADNFSWPKGAYNANLLELAKNYFLSARSIHAITKETFPAADPLRLRAVSSISSLGVTAAAVTALIDAAFANDSWLILVFHKITAGAATVTTECSQADFNTIIDYINTKGIACRTVGDVLRMQS